jgi:drug/metabolite transporter (DMT)-like permease
MKNRDLAGLIILGALWGASFLLIKVAVPEFGAVALMAVRVVFAAAVLVPLILLRGQHAQILGHWRAIVVMGILHYAIPFSLFAYSMLTLSAGYSSIINASSPLFAGIIAWFWLGERLNASRIAGILVGFIGVVIVVGDKLAVGTGTVVLAVLASLLAAFCYGLAAVLAKKRLSGVDPVVVAGGSMIAAAAVLLPLSFWLWPAAAPSQTAWSMAAILGVVGTAAAFVLYFRLIASIGPSRSITVTFLIPVFAVLFGAVFIDEKLTGAMIAGGLVVALGVALSVGLIDLRELLRKSGVLATRTVGALLLIAAFDDTPPDAHAEEWHVDVPVYVAANSFSYQTASGWDTFATLATSAELEVAKIGRPWVVNLFAEYHYSDELRVNGTTFAGVQGSFIGEFWDASGYWFSSRYPDSASRQTFMTRLRHQLRPGQKMGVEYLAYLDSPGDGELKLGYYGVIGESISVKLLAGAVPADNWQALGRLEFSWRLR